MIISKTIFLQFLQCPKNVWLKHYKPEVAGKFEMSDFERHLVEQGNEVESCARNLFPGGVEVVSTGEESCRETVRFMASKTPTIFQATFIIDGFIARNDMLSWNSDTDRWDLYEVKGTNSLKENSERDHIDDVAFQVSVLNRANIQIGRYFVIHLNKEYVRNGLLDIDALFIKEDVTDKVLERLAELEKQMELAKSYLNQETEPVGNCECVYRGRKKHCTAFKYINPHVPDYSIHDLSRITEKKLELLVEGGIFELGDIPETFKLSKNQQNQVLAHVRQRPIIDSEKIKEVLNGLSFPLYFFDYEAFGPAIPVFDGFSPYKHIPFQFSLHVLDTPNAELKHFEFLHEELTDPSRKVAELLRKYLLPGGTVVAWHKPFEGMVNRELGIRLPEYSDLMQQINDILYDLKDIFTEQYYVHHGFKGSASIKKVLPVLTPELRYDRLDIHEGGQAADAWWTMVSPATDQEESKRIANNLKEYCGLDTYAMYAIWKHLYSKVRE